MQQQSEPLAPPVDFVPSKKSEPPKYTYWVALVLGLLSVLAVIYGLYLYFQSLNAMVVTPQQTEFEQIERALTAPTAQQPGETIEQATDSPSRDTSWTSYVSDQLGLTFEYPSSYDEPDEQTGYISILSPLDPPSDKSGMVQDTELKIEIVKEASPPNDSPEQCWQAHTFGDTTILSQSPIVVDGVTTENVVWEGMGSGQFVCVIKNNQRFLINKYPAETTRQAEFDQFLATFKIVSTAR